MALSSLLPIFFEAIRMNVKVSKHPDSQERSIPFDQTAVGLLVQEAAGRRKA